MSEYWDNQMSGFNRGLGNIASAMIQQPRARAQADLMRRQGSAASASADFNTERARELIQKGNLVEALQHTAPLALRAYQEGRLDDPSIGDFTGAAAALTGQDKGDVQESFKKGLGTLMSMSGKIPLAAAVENPVSVNNNQVNADERAKRPLNIAGALMSPDGKVLGVAPKVVPAGSMLAGAAEGTNAPPVVVNNPKPTTPKTGPYPPGVLDQVFKQALKNSPGGTNVTAAFDTYKKFVPENAAGSDQPAQKPTRALARQYVDKFGDQATDKLKEAGYDPSGYAD